MISYYKLYIINYVWFWITADWDVNNIPACSVPANVIWTKLWLICILEWCSIYSAVQRRYLIYTVETIHINLNVTNICLMFVGHDCNCSCTMALQIKIWISKFNFQTKQICCFVFSLSFELFSSNMCDFWPIFRRIWGLKWLLVVPYVKSFIINS